MNPGQTIARADLEEEHNEHDTGDNHDTPVVKLILERADDDGKVPPNLVHAEQKHSYAGGSHLWWRYYNPYHLLDLPPAPQSPQ